MTNEAVHGLNCPRCGGMVPIPEGQVIVACPYCEQCSVVAAGGQSDGQAQPAAVQLPAIQPADAQSADAPSVVAQPPVAQQNAAITQTAVQGSLGVRRYQAPLRVQREQAIRAMQGFLSGKFQIARDAASAAELQEAFVVHLPFWAVWGRGLAYAFGQVKVGSGDHQRWEPREKKLVRELTWNCPACEVGEFGVQQIPLEGCPLEPFEPDNLHRTGMVFEPVGAENAALEAARQQFDQEIRGAVQMGRTSQLFTRLVRARLGVVYYPLWVLRYLYRGRAFQIVVDGVNGQVLYGKAPGSVVYRAAVLVGGMAAGAVAAIDIPAIVLMTSSSSDDNPFVLALIIFVVGIGILFGSYRTYRYAEHYEYHRFGKLKALKNFLPSNLPGRGTLNLGEVGEIISKLEKFQ